MAAEDADAPADAAADDDDEARGGGSAGGRGWGRRAAASPRVNAAAAMAGGRGGGGANTNTAREARRVERLEARSGALLSKPLPRGRQEVSLSAFAYLLSELVQHSQARVRDVAALERRLEDAGAQVGARMLEVVVARDKQGRRETRVAGVLQLVSQALWKALLGKPADSLEILEDDEYIVCDNNLLVNRFVSVPKDLGQLNCGAFVAGIVRGALEDAGFPATVSAYYAPVEGQARPRTNVLIKFAPEVMEREARLGA